MQMRKGSRMVSVCFDAATCAFLGSLRSHICPAIKEAAVQKAVMDPQLQPLDVAVNKLFKDRVARYRREWLAKDATAKRLPSVELRRGMT